MCIVSITSIQLMVEESGYSFIMFMSIVPIQHFEDVKNTL
jgi:hypothetical protein